MHKSTSHGNLVSPNMSNSSHSHIRPIFKKSQSCNALTDLATIANIHEQPIPPIVFTKTSLTNVVHCIGEAPPLLDHKNINQDAVKEATVCMATPADPPQRQTNPITRIMNMIQTPRRNGARNQKDEK